MRQPLCAAQFIGPPVSQGSPPFRGCFESWTRIVEVHTPPWLHNHGPFAPAPANNFPGPALVELKWASTSECKFKVKDSQHRDHYRQSGVVRAAQVKMIQLKVRVVLQHAQCQADSKPDDA